MARPRSRSRITRRVQGAFTPRLPSVRINPLTGLQNYRRLFSKPKTRSAVAVPSARPLKVLTSGHRPTSPAPLTKVHNRVELHKSKQKRVAWSKKELQDEKFEVIDRPTCKPRPRDNKSKGGGSRDFIPYCDRKK